MKIGGFRTLSLIDYPGYTSFVVFTRGCNFRCVYCHNRHLVYPEQFKAIITEEEIFYYIHKYKNRVESIVVSGGEPTFQKDLPEFLRNIRETGLKIKLDTNGSNPEMLEEIIKSNLIDYIAMDIKAGFGNYTKICNTEVEPDTFVKSIQIIKKSGLEHHFRTTVVKDFISKEDIAHIKEIAGTSHMVFQNFKKPDYCEDMPDCFELIPDYDFENYIK